MTGALGPQFLPGMEHVQAQEGPRPLKAPATSGQWSGQIPGQLVMGVHEGDHGNLTTAGDFTPHSPFETDGHGFIREQIRTLSSRVSPSPDKDAGNPSVHDLYSTHGGGNKNNATVQAHWARQPLVNINSDTPIHTGQAAETTEGKLEGRERINAIRSDLAAGGSIEEPTWLVKQSGRLFAQDGHHRVVATREEGLPTYPARVWDIDAETAARKKRGLSREVS